MQIDPILRERVLNRDGHKCQKCESTDRLHVHHLIPKIANGKDDESNLTTLCLRCHRKAERAVGPSSRNVCIKSNPMQRETITVDEKTAKWLAIEVAKKRFRNISHGCEFAVNELMKKEKRE